MPRDMHTFNAELVEKMVGVFAECQVNGMVTYRQLDRAIGQDCRSRKMAYLLMRAKNLSNERYGCLWKTVQNQGYLRLSGSEAHADGVETRSRSRRMLKRSSKRMTNVVSHNNLTVEDSNRAFRSIAFNNLLAERSKEEHAPHISEEFLSINPHEVLRNSLEEMRAALRRDRARERERDMRK